MATPNLGRAQQLAGMSHSALVLHALSCEGKLTRLADAMDATNMLAREALPLLRAAPVTYADLDAQVTSNEALIAEVRQ